MQTVTSGALRTIRKIRIRQLDWPITSKIDPTGEGSSTSDGKVGISARGRAKQSIQSAQLAAL
jgi:hypothetical protein